MSWDNDHIDDKAYTSAVRAIEVSTMRAGLDIGAQ